uniref:RNA replicase n=3 Tax=Plasmopara halstedii virus A TaxID=468928 RepID=E2IBQ5_9VIRU|nr:RNA-dependent RNA polymerase [Plasmopara halstedii virus A]
MSFGTLFSRYTLMVSSVSVVGLATPWRYVMSKTLNEFGEEWSIEPANLRSLFGDIQVVEFKRQPGHPHGAAAADRSAGSYFIERFARDVGREVVYYQCSNSDLRNGRSGAREWYWMKDAYVQPKLFSLSSSSMVSIIDVDQYVDMNWFLTEHFCPVLLYTFQPSVCAADRGEYSYTFNSNNEVIYRVAGGAEYVHKVWNYDTDVVTTTRLFAGKSWTKWRNWIPFVTCAYLVDKRQMDADHQIIGLFPVKRWFGPLALLARCLKGRPLSRFKIVRGDFLRLLNHGHNGMTISTGKVESPLCGTITAREDAALASLARTTKSGLTLMHVKKLMPDDTLGATYVYEYHSQKLPEATVVSYSGAKKDGVRGYQFNPMNYDPLAKQSLVSFMSPIIDGGFCPDMTEDNVKQAIAGRIVDVKSVTTMDRFLMKTIDEFAHLLLKSAGVTAQSLLPCGYEDVYERQDRPTQRRILEQAEFVVGKNIGKNFLKREAYGKCSDPRIITTIEGSRKYRYSTFIYGYTDEVIKHQQWYAFGKTPVDVSCHVSRICSTARTISNTDFSRFDGTISEVVRALERRCILLAFRPEYTNELLELLRDQCGIDCYITVNDESVHYNSGLARLSGSPETSTFNSLTNAFCAYLGFRSTRLSSGGHMDATEAYSRLGMYGGDDGITPDLHPSVYMRAARKLGLKLDLQPVERGKRGVKFLNRLYGPEVWFGDTTSMCDPVRALSKFHLCVNMDARTTNIQKLMEKSYAYYLSDKNTPVLGQFVSAVVSHLPARYQFKNIHGIWNAQYEASVQYPNGEITDCGSEVAPDWMVEEFNHACPNFRHDIFNTWISELGNDFTLYLSPPVNMLESLDPVTSHSVVVDGDIVNPVPSLNDTPSVVLRRNRRHTVARRRNERKREGAGGRTNRRKPRL